MFILSLSDTTREHQNPFAVIRALAPSHVSDHQFVVLAPRADVICKVLESYPRRAEPAAALFARALRMVHGSLPFLPDRDDLCFQISEGETVAEAELVETLDIRMRADLISVRWEDGFTTRRVEAPARMLYLDAGHVLEHGLRLAMWGVDDLPAMPYPLDKVQVRVNQGIDVVDREDIPGYARSAMHQRVGSDRPGPGLFYAHDWVDFLTS